MCPECKNPYQPLCTLLDNTRVLWQANSQYTTSHMMSADRVSLFCFDIPLVSVTHVKLILWCSLHYFGRFQVKSQVRIFRTDQRLQRQKGKRFGLVILLLFARAFHCLFQKKELLANPLNSWHPLNPKCDRKSFHLFALL